ncbi:MAG: hypothetical protein N2445_01025 [Acidobacteria bacterium]|nr:hypothetical protein [Acidobacteriota bacterium]
MNDRKLNLSREQIKQLSDANAEMLEGKIFDLQLFGREKNVDFKKFWQKSEEIHSIFKKITPLEKSARKRLWTFFEKVRDDVRKRQAKEKEIEKIAFERVSNIVLCLIEEIKEIISKETSEAFEAEILLYSLEQLKSLTKGEISSLPDIPEKTFISNYLKSRNYLIDKSVQKDALGCIKEAEKWLKAISNKKFEEINVALSDLENNISQLPISKVRRIVKTLTNEILGPFLVKQQKEELKKKVEKFYENHRSQKEREERKDTKGAIKQVEKADESSLKEKKERKKEINIILEELEKSVLKQT